jgi:3-oxoacyl-[acyl-carrier-protein] synthase II
MPIYIHGMGAISPQQSWGEQDLLATPVNYEGSKLNCIEPDYSGYIDAKAIRRMSRIIKMGVASSSMALSEAGLKVPDGIITATGFGCLEDTGTFLSKMVENKEEALNPTPFIQSTHNTIGSQIALLLQCQGYNQTYTQRGFSFENALLDAMLQCQDFEESKFLIGAIDEITPMSHEIQRKFSLFRNCSSSLKLFDGHEGTVNGEASCFFVGSGKRPSKGVVINAVATFFRSGADQLEKAIEKLRDQYGEIDYVLSGRSGDDQRDELLNKCVSEKFSTTNVGYFKHLCGEFPVATGFATWLAARILQSQAIPRVVGPAINKPIKNVLIFNQYLGKYYSLISMSAF